MTVAAGVLDGVRVVEFAQNAAIPHCGRLLAGLGADVVKIEPPEGDAMRRLATLADNESRAYAVINPGKRSVAIDLGSPDAQIVVDALFRWADVALVAFKLPDLPRFGIDWDHAQTVNPRLVHVTQSSLGPEGFRLQVLSFIALLSLVGGCYRDDGSGLRNGSRVPTPAGAVAGVNAPFW